MTVHKAKHIIREYLEDNDLSYEKLTAKTIDFTDLLRTCVIFVTVHGWKPNPAWQGVRACAIKNGFRVEAKR